MINNSNFFINIKRLNMNKSKFAIMLGAVTLGILSFYGRKPYFNSNVTSVKAGTYGLLFSSGTSTVLTTHAGTNNATIQFKTVQGGSTSWQTLQTNGSGSSKIYLIHGTSL
jgi:hypothetical protein